MENNCGVCGSLVGNTYGIHYYWFDVSPSQAIVQCENQPKVNGFVLAHSVSLRTLQVNSLCILIRHLLETTGRNDAHMHTPFAHRSKRRQCTHGDAENNGPKPNGCEKRIKFWLPSIARNKNHIKWNWNKTEREKKKMFSTKLTCCWWRTIGQTHTHKSERD